MKVVSPPPQDTKTQYSESRKAILKSRFVETISKAKISLLTASGAKQQELQCVKERLRSQLTASAKLKQQRKASRLDLGAAEASVSTDDNFRTFEELKRLCGCEVVMGDFSLQKFGLGLVLKDDEEDWEEREMELRKRREAARIAVQAMESKAEKDQTLDLEKQLNILCGYNDGLKWIFKGYPLLGLDLVLKKEFCGDADDDDDGLEDGEITE